MENRAAFGGGIQDTTDKRVSFQDCPQSSPCQESFIVPKKPPPKKQKPLNLPSGHLSSWPAYAPGQTILQNRKPCAQPEWQSTTRDHISPPAAKPRYLEELETYLRRELQALDLTKGKKVQELRLQPYREVFEYFMEGFKTYKPLLASIKNEYEATIAHLKEQIYSLEAVNGILVTASDQCTLQILALQKQERIEITNLKEEKFCLLKLIDQMKEEQSSLEIQVAKLRKTVAEEYYRYLTECDARKLLLLDLNEMYRLKEEMNLVKVQDEKDEDTVKLNLALKMARQDLTKAQVELNTMKANYGDVVPRRDFELLQQKCNVLNTEMETLRKDFEDLQDEYNTMLDVHKQISDERDQLCNVLLSVQRSSTPRPQWEKCAEVIPGGPERWSILSAGKSSNQLVDVLLEELGAGLLRERDTFVGRGRSDKVPVFLRCDGVVRNKKLTKKEVVAIIRDIWKEKIMFDQQKGKPSSLPEFFLQYFQKKYGEAIAFDWTYSIFETIKLFRSNEAMTMFHQILIGSLDESVYHSHLEQLNNLLKELTAMDTANTGQLTSDQFVSALKTTFPLKTEEQIQELLDASRASPDATTIMYKLLFLEDEEGKTEPVIAKFKTQYLSEKQAYLRDLQTVLGTLTEVRTDDLRAAFHNVDHGLTDQTVDSYISYAFQLPKEQLDPSGSVPIETVMQRLAMMDIRRQGPPSTDLRTVAQTNPEETEAPVGT